MPRGKCPGCTLYFLGVSAQGVRACSGGCVLLGTREVAVEQVKQGLA